MGDEVLVINGMEVHIQKPHGSFLKGLEIDSEIRLKNRGFSFKKSSAGSTFG
ncbi:MAG: hypothetical protein J5I59_06625 [Saprospiraceae bacterium]|nr:hypothetical protein [Saprospiraceae bacterium]